MYTFDEIQAVDSEIAEAIQLEKGRQNQNIELIASENFVSKAVMAAMGSPLTNKYAEGYPGKRSYGGCQYVDIVENLDDSFLNMGKASTGSKVGTGGMATKLTAATIATAAGTDMIIANGSDFHIIHKIMEGRDYGTLFVGQAKEEFYLIDYIEKLL